MYHDAIALASAKVFAEFEHLLNEHPDIKADACAQMIERVRDLLALNKPMNAREWADKSLRSCVSQFLIAQGHSAKELADVEASAQKKSKRS